jgi:hypothetical protein
LLFANEWPGSGQSTYCLRVVTIYTPKQIAWQGTANGSVVDLSLLSLLQEELPLDQLFNIACEMMDSSVVSAFTAHWKAW